MNADEYCGLHTVYYFIVSGIGLALILIARNIPTYNETTGEIIHSYSLPFIIFGAVLIILSFVGIIFFAEDKQYK
ncbi:MAG: hypothetical protein MJ181_10110 [Treponema sp.]|nr:hypothetical protein [Treponema sp.]